MSLVSYFDGLSVKSKLRASVTAVIIALTIVMAFMAVSSFRISAHTKENDVLREEAKALYDARQSILLLTLSAMDTIVDKAEGKMYPERIAEADDAFAAIMKDMPKIEAVAATLGKANIASEIKAGVTKVHSATVSDLKRAVETFAGEEEFARLDDEIDGTAGEMLELVSVLAQETNARMVETTGRIHSDLRWVMGSLVMSYFGSILVLYLIISYVGRGIIDPLAGMSRDVAERIGAATSQLISTADHLNDLSEEVSLEITTGASAATEASTNVQTVASSAEEMSASIEEIRRQVKMSSEVSELAVNEAVSANATIENLNDFAQSISAIVGLINEIAEKTNLLALNATIEAARAGEAGKGFAVVASEVKNLASQTGGATEEISKKVSEMQEIAKTAVAAIANIRGTIGDISEANNNVMTAISQQTAATMEISRTINEAAQGVSGTASMIEKVRETAHKTKEDSHQVVAAAQSLADQARVAVQQTDRFMKGTHGSVA